MRKPGVKKSAKNTAVQKADVSATCRKARLKSRRLQGSSKYDCKRLKEISITFRWTYIPLVMSESSMWEYPSISGSTVEARGLGASVARLELIAIGALCAGAEAV